MENYNVLTRIGEIHRLSEYKEIEIPISLDGILKVVIDDISNEYGILPNYGDIEVVIPHLIHDENFVDVEFPTTIRHNEANYIFHKEFDSYTGRPYTLEAESYLSTFDKVDCILVESGRKTSTHISVWYRFE